MKTQIIIISAIIFCTFNMYSQNASVSDDSGYTPDGSAMLDVKSTSKGVLLPRVSLTSLSDATTISTPATGLMIYNTNGALTPGVGYYYNTGTPGAPVWSRIANTNSEGLVVSTTDGTVSLSRYPMGEFYMEGNAVATTIAATSTYYKALGTTTLSSSYKMDNNSVSNRLRYTGTSTKMFHVACTFSLISSGSNQEIKAKVYKNGVPLNNSVVHCKLGGSGDHTSTAIHVMVSLAQNDYLELYVSNLTSTNSITITDMNFFGMGVSMGMD